MLFANSLRVVVLILFGLTMGETALIFRKYLKVARRIQRLLPVHVAVISLGLMMLEFYVAFTTATRGIGQPFSWLIIYNIVSFVLVYTALVIIRTHVNRKVAFSDEISSLLEDPNGLP